MVVERSDRMRLVAPPVHSPEEGIALAEEHHPDVVRRDVVYKGSMKGLGATRKIKEPSPATRVVIIPAPDGGRLLGGGGEAGAWGFLESEEHTSDLQSHV